jgi:hypothetical protein
LKALSQFKTVPYFTKEFHETTKQLILQKTFFIHFQLSVTSKGVKIIIPYFFKIPINTLSVIPNKPKHNDFLITLKKENHDYTMHMIMASFKNIFVCAINACKANDIYIYITAKNGIGEHVHSLKS